MLVDAILARNEFALVKLRQQYLDGQVDKMVICESPVTFSGEPKPLHFSKMLDSGQFPGWVEVFVIDIPPELVGAGFHMDIEDYVRWEFLQRLFDTFPNSRFLFQDVDEFPSPSQLKSARAVVSDSLVISVPMNIFYRRINWELARKANNWLCAKLILGLPPKQNIRSIFSNQKLEGEFGAHFSFLEATPEGMKDKLSHYPHQDVNVPAIWKPKYLRFCDEFGVDHLGRAGDKGLGLLNFVPFNEFSTVMAFAKSNHPEWVGTDFPHSKLMRLIAAQIATRFKSTDGGDDFISADGDSFSFRGMIFGLGCLLEVWLTMARRFIRRAPKRIQKHAGLIFLAR